MRTVLMSDPYDGRRRGPRLKPTLDTAGDISYSARRHDQVRQQLRELLDRQQQRQTQLEAWREERDAEDWIRSHGGSVSAALKLTHPDHGGNAADFQKTMRARDVLRGRDQRPT